MREPLLWFLVVGVLLFSADNYFNQDRDTIIVDAGIRDHLANLWQSQAGKSVSQQELDSLVQGWIKEEVFYREAIALGLDRDDSIIRRRLVQKLMFIIDDVDADPEHQAELEAFYRANISAYTLPERYSFSQIYFKNADSAKVIITRLEGGENWRDLADASMLNDSYVSRSKKELAANFGAAFIPRLDDLVLSEWVGPIESTFGFHLIRLDNIQPSEATPLQYIKDTVVRDYRQKLLALRKDSYYEKLLEKYQIVIE